jgi:hypothetical protein
MAKLGKVKGKTEKEKFLNSKERRVFNQKICRILPKGLGPRFLRAFDRAIGEMKTAEEKKLKQEIADLIKYVGRNAPPEKKFQKTQKNVF